MRDLISGLNALHKQDILHLDIKPENILFDGHGPDAHIKITDFGLSKIFADGKCKEPKPRFNYKLMQEKLKAFAESGDLNRDRLRGTIGYMSPELILTGHVCKGTDVFAAGVVLYILLCGRPPFNSKSNREVLEKTCKGVYSMSGAEWDDISDEAKDLVRRMLVVNPEERIATEDILSHPWLKLLDEEAGDDNSSVSSTEVDLFSKVSTNKRKGTTNLANALRQLSGHVKQLRSEKLATNVTRLVSLMQQGDKLKSSLSDKYLVLLNATVDNADSAAVKAEKGADAEQEYESIVLDPEFRSALTKAWDCIAEEQGGKLTIEQMIALIKYNYSLPQGPNAVMLVPLLMCRFLDRDGDGFIGPDDLFAAQALIIQRAEAFLKIVFRMYIEAVWYPGRQLNLMHLLQNTNVKGQGLTPSASSNNILSQGDSATDSNTFVVEPPKYITARHVATVFEKLGYDSSHAATVFSILCEAINRIKMATRNSATRPDAQGEDADDGFGYYESDLSSKYTGVQPPQSSPLPPPPSTPNAALAKAFADDEDDVTPPTSRTPTAPATASSAGFNANSAKMDFNDFKRYAACVSLLSLCSCAAQGGGAGRYPFAGHLPQIPQPHAGTGADCGGQLSQPY